jgi:hypothetical protein
MFKYKVKVGRVLYQDKYYNIGDEIEFEKQPISKILEVLEALPTGRQPKNQEVKQETKE